MKAKEPKTRRTPWRDNVEALAMAIVLALVLKAFVVEAYKIPTGSMQPTLMGLNYQAGPGRSISVNDRILVDKFTPLFRSFDRWEVVVFRYPLDRSTNFVKRIVGVPGDRLRVRHGDLQTFDEATGEWSVPRRPAAVQRSMWKRLDDAEPTEPRWSAGGAPGWRTTGREVAARGTGTARYDRERSSIVDAYDDGYPDPLRAILPSRPPTKPGAPSHDVGDLRLEGRVEALAGLRVFEVELTEGDRRYRFRLPGPAADADARPSVAVENGPPGLATTAADADASYRLPAGRAVRFAVENLDDRLALELDGEVVATLPVPEASDQRSRMYLRIEGEGADVTDLVPYRDVYYTQSSIDGDAVYDVPEGHYFVMGDNTQDSSDSREWQALRYALLDEQGAATGPVVVGNRREGRGAGHDQNPRRLSQGVDVFTDLWGEPHRIQRAAEGRAPEFRAPDSQLAAALPPERLPFVPEELVVGRALAVFWPIRPFQGIVRLRWVR